MILTAFHGNARLKKWDTSQGMLTPQTNLKHSTNKSADSSRFFLPRHITRKREQKPTEGGHAYKPWSEVDCGFCALSICLSASLIPPFPCISRTRSVSISVASSIGLRPFSSPYLALCLPSELKSCLQSLNLQSSRLQSLNLQALPPSELKSAIPLARRA